MPTSIRIRKLPNSYRIGFKGNKFNSYFSMEKYLADYTQLFKVNGYTEE